MMAGDAPEGGYSERTQRLHVQRALIAAEILETERTYVDGLGLIEKLYIAPLLLSAQQPSAILSRKEVRQLFANFPDIITLSRELLSQLEARLGNNTALAWDAETGRLGDIFVRIAPFLKMYSLYLRNFRSALENISRWLTTNQEFAQFIRKTNANPECKGLAFQSYLLLPVQRIPRYKLLLEDLLKHTPAGHVDRQSIGDALRAIEEVAEFVNENIQEHEMTLNMIEIQRSLGLKESLLVPGRRLIKTGTLTKICRKNHQLRHFYLFSDILLYSSSQVILGEDPSGHRRVPLEDCKVMDVPDGSDSSTANQFTIISHEKSFIVYTSTLAEKNAWVQALTQAIFERREARDTLQMDSSLKRRIARARRSTMMHFPRVAENFDAPVWDPDESAESCYICFRTFSLFVRRHHCRACGKIVCNSCSRKNIFFVAQDSTEVKEGRGCDQCIARLFGREALESPQGTIHKILSRSRHSLDPGALIQSLSALTTGSHQGTIRHLHFQDGNSPIDESPVQQGDGCDLQGSVEREFEPLPMVAETVVTDDTQAPIQFSGAGRDNNGGNNSLPQPPGHSLIRRPATPLPAPMRRSTHIDRLSTSSSCCSEPSSIGGGRTSRLSLVLARRLSKHSSMASNVLDWESQNGSARSTLLYETSPNTLHPTDTNSPISTVSRAHRASLVSSSCSTVVSDSSQRAGRGVRVRRPLVFTPEESNQSSVDESNMKSANTQCAGSRNNSHSSLLALYDHPVSLISPAAPPKLSLVQAEASAARGRNPTLCSLCHGSFDRHGSQQHQCASCLSLVCSRCISHGNTGGKRSSMAYARILSMYVPDGYDRMMAGGRICDSCAAHTTDNLDSTSDESNPSAAIKHAVLTEG